MTAVYEPVLAFSIGCMALKSMKGEDILLIISHSLSLPLAVKKVTFSPKRPKFSAIFLPTPPMDLEEETGLDVFGCKGVSI